MFIREWKKENSYYLTTCHVSVMQPGAFLHNSLLDNTISVSHSAVSDSLRPHGLQPTRLLHAWDSPGKSTGVGCHFLLHSIQWRLPNAGVSESRIHLLPSIQQVIIIIDCFYPVTNPIVPQSKLKCLGQFECMSKNEKGYCVKTEQAFIVVMLPQAKEHLCLSEAGRGRNSSSNLALY